MEPGINPILIKSKKDLLPHLHIKLGLMNDFMKAMTKLDAEFKHIQNTFTNRSEAKIKVDIFVGPLICKLLLDANFDKVPRGKEKLYGNLSRQWQPTFYVIKEKKITERSSS